VLFSLSEAPGTHLLSIALQLRLSVPRQNQENRPGKLGTLFFLLQKNRKVWKKMSFLLGKIRKPETDEGMRA
jgi:hypothetical protein